MLATIPKTMTSASLHHSDQFWIEPLLCIPFLSLLSCRFFILMMPFIVFALFWATLFTTSSQVWHPKSLKLKFGRVSSAVMCSIFSRCFCPFVCPRYRCQYYESKMSKMSEMSEIFVALLSLLFYFSSKNNVVAYATRKIYKWFIPSLKSSRRIK